MKLDSSTCSFYLKIVENINLRVQFCIKKKKYSDFLDLIRSKNN